MNFTGSSLPEPPGLAAWVAYEDAFISPQLEKHELHECDATWAW